MRGVLTILNLVLILVLSSALSDKISTLQTKLEYANNETIKVKSDLNSISTVVAGYLSAGYVYTIHNVLATAYSDDPRSINKDIYRDGRTATGIPAGLGIIAVDPDIIEYGSIVYIPQLKRFFIALDTGSAIKGKHIDIYFESEDEALRFGKRCVDVVVCGKLNWREIRDAVLR